MSIKGILKGITQELSGVFETLDEEQLAALEKEIRSADRIFTAGAGRSLLMIRGLAMRLMHMGFTAYVVGETVTPGIRPGDLLIIASGSGSTGTMVVMARKCKQIGARLALITGRPGSEIAGMADLVVTVKAATPKDGKSAVTSIQPGGNTFEQSILLIGDAIIMDIIHERSVDENNRELMERHANLE